MHKKYTALFASGETARNAWRTGMEAHRNHRLLFLPLPLDYRNPAGHPWAWTRPETHYELKTLRPIIPGVILLYHQYDTNDNDDENEKRYPKRQLHNGNDYKKSTPTKTPMMTTTTMPLGFSGILSSPPKTSVWPRPHRPLSKPPRL